MTAESLKPFISLPSAENFSSQKRTTHNLITIGLSATFVILSVVLLGFTIWNSIRVCELQREVNSLNRIIIGMQKRLGLDYLDGLNEFENSYDNILVDDPNSYSQDDDGDEDDDDDEDADDEDEDDIDSDEFGESKHYPPGMEDDYLDDNILDGSGLLGYADDDDDSSYENGFDDFSLPDGAMKPKSERKTRSISSSPNGIPIYQDSYALNRNRTGGPEDERIEQHLLANKSPTPTLRPRPVTTTTTDSPSFEGRGRYHSAPGNMVRSLHPQRRSHRRLHNQRLLRQLVNNGKKREKPQALTAMPYQQRLTAVHYHLNNTISGRHVLHPDHTKLPHDGDVYIGSPHPWARTLEMDKAFELNHGVLTVKTAGLYFIYAQIYYDNRFDRNGFVIYHNVHPFLQCALFVPTNTNKSNTCYTSGVIFLEGNDQLHIRDIHRDREVMLTNAKSFFGVIKLGDI